MEQRTDNIGCKGVDNGRLVDQQQGTNQRYK